MISPKTKYRLKIVLQFVFTGFIVGIVIAYTTALTIPEEPMHIIILRGMFIGSLIGAFLGILEEWLLQGSMYDKPFWQVTFVRVILYASIIGFLLLIINLFIIYDSFDRTVTESIRLYVVEGTYLHDALLSFFAALIVVPLFQIKKLHRPGDLLNFVLGRYNTPTEVERVFLFLDLKSSTSIAEQLGHLQYSYFLKEYFWDMTESILLTEGEIYQYVGDEIIITWKMKKGIKKANCLQCFYSLQSHFLQRKNHYLQKYGYAPQFKAGLHGGKVITTWVGELKKEIVFTGDVLNTTARIQEKCNPLKAELLISGDLWKQLEVKEKYKAQLSDTLQLRGKQEEVALYSVQNLQ